MTLRPGGQEVSAGCRRALPAARGGHVTEQIKRRADRRPGTQGNGHNAVANSHRKLRSQFPTTVISAMMTKLAKHLALLACLMILGKSAGNAPLDQPGIFWLIVVSASLHLSARALRRRLTVHVLRSRESS